MRVFREANSIKLEKGIEVYSFEIDKDNRISDIGMSHICRSLLRSGIDLDVTKLENNKVLVDLNLDLTAYETLTKGLVPYKKDLSAIRDKLLIDSYDIEMKLSPDELREALFSYLSTKPSRLKEILK